MRLALAMILLIGCAEDSGETRACNDTGFDVTDLEDGSQRVGMLANGACSPYVVEEISGSSPPTNLVIDGERYIHLPIDQTSFLTSGRWSFHLTVQHGQNGSVNSVRVFPIED